MRAQEHPLTRPPSDQARRICAIVAAAALAPVVWSLAGMELDRTATSAAGTANLDTLRGFWIATGASWAALTALAWSLRREESARSPSTEGQALRETPRTGVHGRSPAVPPPGGPLGGLRGGLIVVLVALAARVVVLLTHTPALSDDIHRYVFDGHNAAAGVNPYMVTPEERSRPGLLERWPGETATARRVNNPELHTIYLPVSQWVFRASAMVTPKPHARDAASDRPLRVVLVGFEVALMLLLLIALRSRGRSPWWLALYAWHPLPLAEIAGTGHQDIIGITFLLAGLVAGLFVADEAARKLRGSVAPLLWTPFIALATLVKPVALPAAAIILRGRSWRAWATSLAAGAVVCIVVAGPMLLAHDGAPLDNLRATAERFTLKWAHFGSVYEPTLTAIEAVTPTWTNDPQEKLARKICTAALVLVALLVWWRVKDPYGACGAIFLAMVLLTPATHPWYLLWALALIPVVRAPAVWVASLTLPWGYVILGDTVNWTVPVWVMWIAYVPIYATLAWSGVRTFVSR